MTYKLFPGGFRSPSNDETDNDKKSDDETDKEKKNLQDKLAGK